MNLTKISIERPKLAVVLFSLLIFLGITSYFYLSYELVPKFSPPVLTVTTVYPGASPTEVESKVSIVVEDALSSIEYLDQITTLPFENFSLVRLEMKPQADIELTFEPIGCGNSRPRAQSTRRGAFASSPCSNIFR